MDDNFDLMGDIDGQIEDSLEHICENLIDYETIDKLTFTDEVVEENKKLLLNSMIVKFAHKEKNISPVNIVGKGIKESTSINFIRLYIYNRLENRRGFLKNNIRVILMKELNQLWNDIGEGFS